MSNALAISGVSAVLQYCLNLVYTSPGSPLGTVSISALAPDIVQAAVGTATGAALQVNLFLHQALPNASWRNIGYPSLGSDGGTRLKNPPLALDLHYLLTAYGAEDTAAEALLGYAILMLHENPVLPRSLIRDALNAVPNTNPLWNALKTTGLADQIEMIKIVPSTMGREELAWLWTALKADYRPSYPFQVSVVLIEPQTPFSFSLPVLRRHVTAQAGPPAQLLTVQPPNSQTAAAPGDLVTLTGQSLSGATQVVLSNPRLGVNYPPFPPVSVTGTTVTFHVPDDPANFPAGVYNLSLLFTSAGTVTGMTNYMPLPVSVVIQPFGAGAAVNNADGTLVTATIKPDIWPSQTVSLALAGSAVPAQPFETATAAPTFQFPTLTSGSYLARMQVDGVESNVTVQWTPWPPVFTGPFLTIP